MTVIHLLELMAAQHQTQNASSEKVITVNGRFVPLREYDQRLLDDGDDVRVFRVPGGG